MSTMMGLDIETIEHLDFEFSPACERQDKTCDNTAEWFWIIGCCGRMLLLCDECHTALKTFRDAKPDLDIRCRACEHVLPCHKWLMQFGRI